MKKLQHFFILMTTIYSSAVSQELPVSYKCDTASLKGFYAAPEKQTNRKAPGVVIVHAWMGITEHEKSSAKKLAAFGYHALAADIYGEKAHPANSKEAAVLSGYYKKNYTIYQQRIRSAVETLIKQGADPERITVMGYCFGGTGAVEAGRGGLPVKGIISVHGGLGKDSLRANTPIKAKVLVLHGADDPFVQEKEVKKFQQELREGKTDWQMVYYGNAVHAFSDPAAGDDSNKGAAYNLKADERSWNEIVRFLAEINQ